MKFGFRDLQVWKLGMEIVADVYRISLRLPADEKYGISSQIKRAAVSIPSNIAEGYSRNYNKVFISFLRNALGSASEVHTLLLLIIDLKMIDKNEVISLEDKVEHIASMIAKLIKVIEYKIKNEKM